MRIHGILIVLAGGLALSGCFLNPYPSPYTSSERLPEVIQDIDFVAGCWVAKAGQNGPVTGFLRLLRNGPPHTSYQGVLQSVVGAEIQSVRNIDIARDGWSMMIDPPLAAPIQKPNFGPPRRRYNQAPETVLAKLPLVAHRATYNAYTWPATARWLVVEGNGETLALYSVDEGGQRVSDIFDGERDGCD